MKKRIVFCITALLLLLSGVSLKAGQRVKVLPETYAILVREGLLIHDPRWKSVIDTLTVRHAGATVLTFKKDAAECKTALRAIRPRYVALVESPQHIGPETVIGMNMLSRAMDDDPYQDFMWGMITGYTAQTAMRMVRDAAAPIVLKTLVSTITELQSGKWFDQMVDIQDHGDQAGDIWIKQKGDSQPQKKHIAPNFELLHHFHDAVRALEPDLIVTASHATQKNLEMPFSLGNIKAVSGMLYTDFPSGAKSLFDGEKNQCRKVYLPIGNCLIGDMNHTPNSMACGWLTSGGVSCMIGYIVPTWYGRAGWGGLKYMLFNPGRLACQQAFMLNEQEILHKLHKELPILQDKPMTVKMAANIEQEMRQMLGDNTRLDVHQVGYYHDRDVLAFYGDPAWDVRLKDIPEYNDYTITYKYGKKDVEIIIKTAPNYDPRNHQGQSWKAEHVGDLPLACYFPKRIDHPKLTLQPREVKTEDYILEENALLIYKPTLEAGKTYIWKISSK